MASEPITSDVNRRETQEFSDDENSVPPIEGTHEFSEDDGETSGTGAAEVDDDATLDVGVTDDEAPAAAVLARSPVSPSPVKSADPDLTQAFPEEDLDASINSGDESDDLFPASRPSSTRKSAIRRESLAANSDGDVEKLAGPAAVVSTRASSPTYDTTDDDEEIDMRAVLPSGNMRAHADQESTASTAAATLDSPMQEDSGSRDAEEGSHISATLSMRSSRKHAFDQQCALRVPLQFLTVKPPLCNRLLCPCSIRRVAVGAATPCTKTKQERCVYPAGDRPVFWHHAQWHSKAINALCTLC
jgi:hypothetical protein